MPSKLITLVALALLANVSVAQYMSDDFESYGTGYLCYQDPALVPGAPCALSSVGNSGGWDGWFNNPIEAGVVINAPGAGSNGSDQYLDVSPGLGCQDAVHPFKENALTGAGAASGAPYAASGVYPTSGAWTLRCDFQVPVGGLALGLVYWIVNNDYNSAGTATSWSCQSSMAPDAANPGQYTIQDDMAGAGTLMGGWMEGVWYRMRGEICLDANAITIYIDAAGADGMLGTMDDVSTQHSQRVYAAGGPVEIANLDLFSAGGQLYYDNVACTVASGCQVFPYQYNSSAASMTMDGGVANVFAGIPHAFGYSAGAQFPAGSNHTVALDGGLAVGEIAVVPAAEIDGPSNPFAGIFFANSLNVDITTPGTQYVFGGAAPSLAQPVPALTLALGGAVIGFLGGGASTVSSQLAVINPASADGFSCSQAVAIDLITAVGYLEPSTAAVDICGFEAGSGWAQGAATTSTYGANWATGATAGPNGGFSVRTGGTPSGGTGPTGALEGSQYIYCEMSGQTAAQPFEMEMIAAVSPLASVNVFYGVHMNGANSGTGDLLEEDPASPGTWTIIDSVTGAQGGAWVVRTAALIHGGPSVRLKWSYAGATSWQGDYSIDRMAIGL